jgi:hypothetical protein
MHARGILSDGDYGNDKSSQSSVGQSSVGQSSVGQSSVVCD